MAEAKSFSADEARRIGEQIGIDWDSAPFDVEQFRSGMDVELESMFEKMLPAKRETRRTTVREARKFLFGQEAEKPTNPNFCRSWLTRKRSYESPEERRITSGDIEGLKDDEFVARGAHEPNIEAAERLGEGDDE